MATLPFQTFIFGGGQATLTLFFDDVSLKLVRIDWTILSGSLTATLTNTKNGQTRTASATTDGSIALPSGKQFPLAQFTNDDGQIETTHGDNVASVHWTP